MAARDPGHLARPFLRRERIDAVHVSLSPEAYRETFGHTELPALFVSWRDTIRGVWRPERDGRWGGGFGPNPTLRELVARLLTPPGDRD